jgi:methyltransferase (TIGR00027 family)
MEQHFPESQRILYDPNAQFMLSAGMKAFVSLMRFQRVRNWMVNSSESAMPGIWSGILLRKRYIDEQLNAVLGDMDAVVNLGAGLDTRALRLSALKNFPVWELDQIENVSYKQQRLDQLPTQIPAGLRLVPIDFDTEQISDRLAAYGYPAGARTFYIMEGVTQYLTEAGILATFAFLSEAPLGSKLVFTYVRRDFLEGSVMHGWEKGYDKYVRKDGIWIYGKNPEEWPDFLKAFRWRVTEDISSDLLAARYHVSAQRELATTLIERTLLAEKIN